MTTTDDIEPTQLGDRFSDALTYAAELHSQHWRKDTGIPYVAHLLAVTSLVLEDGGGEDEAIAALLHDAVEDQGGAPVLLEIRRRYGERVAHVVAECSDTDQDPKPAWDVRKQRYLAHLPEASPEALRVSLADKVHNARAIVRDYRIVGEALWGRFKSPRDQQLWYYGELARAFQKLKPGPLADELSGLVAELEELVA